MRSRIIYGIIKTYQGIFSKTHIGNVQILIIEMEKKFWVLNILGEMEDGRYGSQLLLNAPSQYINQFMDEFEEEEKFIPIEEIFCNIPKESEDSFSVILQKKGTYLQGNYNITFSSDYSSGNIRIYLIEGKLNVLLHNSLKNKIQLNMSALKKQSIATPLIDKFVKSIRK